MFSVGDSVKVVFIPQKYQNKLLISPDVFNYIGVISKTWDDQYGVCLNGIINTTSKEGLFWFHSSELRKNNFEGDFIMSERMEKYNYVAIVNLVEGYGKKDYGLALYDSDWQKCCNGCYVLVNPQNKITLGVIKKVKTVEEYGKNVTNEVIGVCDMSGYNDRVEARQRELDRQKKEAQLKKELDERISKLKDMDYYKRMVDELGNRDSELKSLVDELVKVAGE